MRQEFHEWRHENLTEILEACVILHKMLVHWKTSGNLNEFDGSGICMSAHEVVEEFEEELFHSVSTPTLCHSELIEQLIGTADSIHN